MSKDRFGRELYPIVCAECGNEDMIPIKPKNGRKYYFKSCWWKIKNQNKDS